VKAGRILTALVLLALCLGVWAAPLLAAERARVARVIDGDTLVLADGRRVRLIGVDAPEVDCPYRQAEPWGYESQAYLKQLVEGKRVRLEFEGEPFDKYGRTLAYVYLGDVLVNGRIIRDGQARLYRRFAFEYKEQFGYYEAEAKRRGLGLWGQ
jgi:micrococcal nuclease